MLKTVMSIYISILTALRLINIIVVFASGGTNLPLVVIILSAALIVFGLYIIIRWLIKKIRLRELLICFIVYGGVIIFNLLYITFRVPVEISFAESMLAGSILEIFIGLVFIYYAIKQVHSQYVLVFKDKNLEENIEENDKTGSV